MKRYNQEKPKHNGYDKDENCGFTLCPRFHIRQVANFCPYMRDGFSCFNFGAAQNNKGDADDE